MNDNDWVENGEDRQRELSLYFARWGTEASIKKTGINIGTDDSS